MHYSSREKHERIERHVFLLLFSDKFFNAFKMFRFYIYIYIYIGVESVGLRGLQPLHAFKCRAEPPKMGQALRK